jgi:beta-lactamase class A
MQDALLERVSAIAADGGAEEVAVALYDYRDRLSWSVNADVAFHAASTIKLAVLLGVYAAIDAGRLEPLSRVHVRNRFLGAVDGHPFRVDVGRDANREVYAALGRTLRVSELARHMITTSSNLATNLLLDLIGTDSTRDALRRAGIEGIDLVRGVEDEEAWRKGINNTVTAAGLLELLRAIEERRAASAEACDAMLEILHGQEFRSGIPAGVPDDARVANKTGEMSTVAHDAGIIYPPGREPYVLVILTRWRPDVMTRTRVIAGISSAVYRRVTGGD